MRTEPTRDRDQKARPSRRAVVVYYLGIVPITLVMLVAYFATGKRSALIVAGFIAMVVYVAIALPILLWGNPRPRS